MTNLLAKEVGAGSQFGNYVDDQKFFIEKPLKY